MVSETRRLYLRRRRGEGVRRMRRMRGMRRIRKRGEEAVMGALSDGA